MEEANTNVIPFPDASGLENNVLERKPQDSPGCAIAYIQWALVCASLYVSIFIYGPDTTIAADVQGSVVEAFCHVDQQAWIGAGFPLRSVSVILSTESWIPPSS
ncbi:Fc.00g056730.m01.CDS01 [Cosmosporella sp. VM-42]